MLKILICKINYQFKLFYINSKLIYLIKNFDCQQILYVFRKLFTINSYYLDHENGKIWRFFINVARTNKYIETFSNEMEAVFAY